MIASLALPALFIVSGLFALGVLVITWRAYATEIRAIRYELNRIESERQFLVSIVAAAEPVAAGRRGSVRRNLPVVSGPMSRAGLRPALRAAA